MSDEDWDSGFGKSVAVYLNGLGIPELDARGQRVTDNSFFLCFNAHHEPIEFTLAARRVRPSVGARRRHLHRNAEFRGQEPDSGWQYSAGGFARNGGARGRR